MNLKMFDLSDFQTIYVKRIGKCWINIIHIAVIWNREIISKNLTLFFKCLEFDIIFHINGNIFKKLRCMIFLFWNDTVENKYIFPFSKTVLYIWSVANLYLSCQINIILAFSSKSFISKLTILCLNSWSFLASI